MRRIFPYFFPVHSTTRENRQNTWSLRYLMFCPDIFDFWKLSDAFVWMILETNKYYCYYNCVGNFFFALVGVSFKVELELQKSYQLIHWNYTNFFLHTYNNDYWYIFLYFIYKKIFRYFLDIFPQKHLNLTRWIKIKCQEVFKNLPWRRYCKELFHWNRIGTIFEIFGTIHLKTKIFGFEMFYIFETEGY